jgi:hypothetical protein
MNLHIMMGCLSMQPRKHQKAWISLPRGRGLLAGFLACAGLGLGCDSGSHGKDASTATTLHSSHVSVRLDLPAGGAASVSMLAFRAEGTDVAASDVLGAVDPLVASAPESSCELRDVAGTARQLRAQGGLLNLQELGGVSLAARPEERLLARPKVYPPFADVVSGVIAEAGPLDLAQLPESFTLEVPTKTGDRMTIKLALPPQPSVADSSEAPLDSRSSISINDDLVLRVYGAARTFLEIRAFGAPSAIACAVGSSGWVVVPRDLLAKLAANAGRAPFSLEAVWRDSKVVPGGNETRVSFEVRSSAVLELRR